MVHRFLSAIALFIGVASCANAQGETDTLVLHFGFGSWALSAQATATLDRYLSNAGKPVSIHAYCDIRGSATYNEQLSLQRALAVQAYLVDKGFAGPSSPTVVGHVSANPIDPDTTETARARNRRVEIVFSKPTTEKAAGSTPPP